MNYCAFIIGVLLCSNLMLYMHACRLSTKLHEANVSLAKEQKSLRIWKRAYARVVRMVVASGMKELRVGTVICNDRITHDRN